MAIVRSEGLCQWRIPVSSSLIEPAAFRPEVQYLNCAITCPLRQPLDFNEAQSQLKVCLCREHRSKCVSFMFHLLTVCGAWCVFVHVVCVCVCVCAGCVVCGVCGVCLCMWCVCVQGVWCVRCVGCVFYLFIGIQYAPLQSNTTCCRVKYPQYSYIYSYLPLMYNLFYFL